MNQETTKIIEKYLSGELTQEEKELFEERLLTNDDLRNEKELQQTIHEAAQRSAVRKQIMHIGRKHHFMKKLKWGGIGLGVLVLMVSSALVKRSFTKTNDDFNLNEVKQLTDQLSEKGPIDNLKSAFFAWNANDTAFLSAEGVLVSIPENAFLLNDKPYNEPAVIQWQEAIDGVDIVKAGLSTTSNGSLLETQGMFSFSAKTPLGEQLTINPEIGVYVQVPVAEHKEGMKLFDGDKDKNGNINWVKPRPLEKIPVPIAMSNLDFYPPDYEASLNKLKARKDKKYRDSLYLSFEHLDEVVNFRNITDYPELEGRLPLFVIPQRKITVDEMKFIYGRNVPINYNMNFEEAFILKHRNQNVSADLKDFPALFFINDKHGRKYLYDKAQRSKLLKDYLNSNSFELEKWSPQPNNGNRGDQSLDFKFIPPTSVLSFWNSKFNNTLLSTREFENRMKVIHQICDKSVLDLYVSNLNKPMREIDQMAAKKGYSQFNSFANEYVGALNTNSPHLIGLSSFYEQAVKQLKQSVKENRDKEGKQRKQWDKELASEREKEISRTVQRNENAFKEEYTLNSKKVRLQFGRVIGVRIYGRNPICNIDRFVIENTLSRKTNELFDPLSGKKAQINYSELRFEIPEYKNYDRLFAYVFPDKLNSYHRIEGVNGNFRFQLNEEIAYDLAIVGITANGYSYVQRISIKGGEMGAIKLEDLLESKLDENIRSLNAKRGVKAFNVKDEIGWLKKEQKNYVEQKRRSDELEFRAKIRSKVFPCECGVSETIADTISWLPKFK